MQYSAGADERKPEFNALKESLEALIQGLGLVLIELDVFVSKARKGIAPGAKVRLIVYKPGVDAVKRSIGTDDCARVHRAVLPQLELAFPENDLYLEVSTPGITRQAKDGAELAHYTGRGLRVWRTDISDWSAGLLEAADGQGITIKVKEGCMRLDYSIIAKAKLDPSQEDYIGH